MTKTLRIALPKGRMMEESLRVWTRLGSPVAGEDVSSRRLILPSIDGRFEFLPVKSQDVPAYVEAGVADAGVVGYDVLHEHRPDVLQPLDLGFGACRLAVAAPEGAPYPQLAGSGTPRVATKYVATARRFFGARGLQVELVRIAGSVEIAPLLGLSHWILDLVETGRTLRENGLTTRQIDISDGALARLISRYTREAGVRTLERQIGTLARKAARRIAEGNAKRVRITERSLEGYLGAERFTPESEAEENLVGVATGMYFTPVGGDILFVETSITPGKGNLVLTGQLGDVMKESARAALTYTKSNADRFGISRDKLDNSDIHIHVPAGATPKEGPSAGGALATSLISALTGIPVRKDVAMTGEVTLRGRYLPIGGLKEKILGARRAGIKHVVFPEANMADLKEIAPHLRKSIEAHPVSDLDGVLDVALVGGLAALEKASGSGSGGPEKKSPRRSRRKEPETPATLA